MSYTREKKVPSWTEIQTNQKMHGFKKDRKRIIGGKNRELEREKQQAIPGED